MLKCKQCGVPLRGFLSKIPRVIFNVHPSKNDPAVCNKCQEKNKERKYKCHICGRMIHEEHSIEHVKAEEYLTGLIKKDRQHWQGKEPTDEQCYEYYRELIRKTEI
ncbi:MAG: hypothetical protein JW867_03995 [Candidatus Omnitrophica bacterium]|nr:hypothetical protein [Candidatus Omnitrophota bacterium]